MKIQIFLNLKTQGTCDSFLLNKNVFNQYSHFQGTTPNIVNRNPWIPKKLIKIVIIRIYINTISCISNMHINNAYVKNIYLQ